ncbi:MAG: NnrS family protein [Proteobacteria bacterium]|nr:NnrS family protein [Pseudomonadota bacterium]
MNTVPAAASAALARQLTAAPHRLMFFIGASNVLLAMLWWTLWLGATRWGWLTMPQPLVAPRWMHAIVMQYQVLPPFVFGFLLTTFPRWMNQPSLQRQHYVPVGIGLFGGEALTLIGVLGHPHAVHLGIVLSILGWTYGLALLWTIIWRDQKTTWHAISCASALTMGWAGLVSFAVYLHHPEAALLTAAVKLGGFGLLLPLFFTVCHRMIPFFAGNVIPGYTLWRPMWALAALWVFLLAHLTLDLFNATAWLWVVDLPFAALTATLVIRWWGRGPALLTVLFIGFAWMPVAFVLFSAQSLWELVKGVPFVLGLGPPHALFIGCFGSLLVAMVTRVTQGHAGRPLELGKAAAFAFVSLQVVAVVRIVSDDVPDALAWQAVAGIGWLLAFMPWVIRSLRIYLAPRVDGRPG